ncbi:MAG: hypothetical protein IT422_00035 [Pirellulaceae bacterium]|nr:hypothetical protein [Pirellulaceae bacterium]
MSRSMFIPCTLLVLQSVVWCSAARSQTVQYDVLYLKPPISNLHRTYARDINDWGDVIGNVRNGEYINGGSDVELVFRGFYFDRQTGSYQFAPPDMIFTAFNNFGQCVGGPYQTDDWWGGWQLQSRWLSGGGIGVFWNAVQEDSYPLPPLAGDTVTIPTGINDQGLVTGLSSYVVEQLPFEASAVVWQVGPSGVGEAMELPALTGHAFCAASAIGPPNSGGVATVLGQSGSDWNGEDVYPVRWKVKVKANGQLRLVEGPTIIGLPATGALEGWAHCGFDVNSKAYSVGQSDFEAFRTNNNLNFELLKPLKVDGVLATRGYACGVNEARDIIGFQFVPNEGVTYRATLWPGGGKSVDLNDLCEIESGKQLTYAFDINNLGEVVAQEDKPKRFTYSVKGVILIPRP